MIYKECSYEKFNIFLKELQSSELFEKKLGDFIFRGESSSKYTLLPSALREEGRKKLKKLTNVINNLNQKLGDYWEEFNPVYKFFNIANKEGLIIPNIHRLNKYPSLRDQIDMIVHCREWIPSEFYELFALAQHYGVPTRLLDWTFDINIALYFSIYGVFRKIWKSINKGESKEKIQKDMNEKEFVIWMLNFKSINSSNKDIPLKFIIPPYYHNDNLSMQKGILTLYSEKIDLKEMLSPMSIITLDEQIKRLNINDKSNSSIAQNNISPLLIKIKIPWNEIFKVKHYLDRLHYTFSNIYAGYPYIAEGMRIEKEWEICENYYSGV